MIYLTLVGSAVGGEDGFCVIFEQNINIDGNIKKNEKLYTMRSDKRMKRYFVSFPFIKFYSFCLTYAAWMGRWFSGCRI